MTRAALALALVGCAQLPSTLRSPTPDERDAIAVTIETWGDWRELPDTSHFDDTEIALIARDELQAWCYARSYEVNGCLWVVQRHAFDPPHYAIYAADDLSMDEVAAVIIHEVLHAIRGKLVLQVRDDWDAHSARLNEGEREGCEIYYAADHWHCDTAIWTGIEPDAYRRWLEL